jgi:molecular chaperone DnaK
VFSTAADNQPSVDIHVLQGEREMAGDNKSLGRFILDGIPPAGRGIPQIEVTFDIDASGILSVKATDKASGKEQSIRIEASTGLSKEEIERMQKDAEAHADEDKLKKEAIEARNMADSLSYTTEKAMKEAGDKLTDEDKAPVQEKLDALNAVKNGDNLEEIKKATEELSTAAQAIGQKLYAAEAAAAEGTAEAPKDAETTEAQVENSEPAEESETEDVEPAEAKKTE